MEHVLELGHVLPVGDPLTLPARAGALDATIRAVAAGDQDAFARLYADYVRMVRAILLGRVPRRDVDDLAQEVGHARPGRGELVAQMEAAGSGRAVSVSAA